MSDVIPAGHEVAAAFSEDPGLRAFSESLACVQVSASLAVNGRVISYEQSLPLHEWRTISDDLAWREGYERHIRRCLAEALVDALNPPVVVRAPDPVDEAVARISAGCRPDHLQDAAAGGAGAARQQPELGSKA
ncbi:hypothetical protein EV284_6415 [Streptomyces sp. BK022]|uniref:hypothetical protein n=1 Tax=Streptomyces sp. BK022 TaxID=2512123 RepID=UPI001028ED18|nr:hypothetical protein [Streptomyces sp. BK022]RZU28249.1 hypothetical protein EV284_6415 [Streptomyces sp. BK022]